MATGSVVPTVQTDFAERAVEPTDAPSDRETELLDVRELGPPKPLTETLETLPQLADETAMVQVNDRAPRHLYPKPADRGYAFETVADEGVALTAIGREENEQ